MRLIFMGTPDFSVPILQALAQHHEIAAVYTQPPRPAGRGKAPRPSPVQIFAENLHLQVRHPTSLKTPEAQADFAALQADAAVVVAYGLILPQAVLDAPRLGCLNIHASLLPRWRGAAPIHRAIMAGDSETGICIMQMDAGLDTGDMLLEERLPIAPTDTTATLHDKLATLGGRLAVEALEIAACGGFRPVKQPEAGITYAHKIEKAEAAIDWRLPADAIARRVRAFDPFPGAATPVGGEVVKIWRCEIESNNTSIGADCGRILSVNPDFVAVQCGQGVLRLTELQRAGGKRLPVADFLRGFPLAVGQTLGGTAA